MDQGRAAKYADVVADVRALPFPDDYADQMIAVHLLEHFYEWEVQDLLTEWKRVLKPGGELILELPCLDQVFAYLKQAIEQNVVDLGAQMTWWALWGDPRYKDPAMTHKWGYTRSLLMQAVQKAGFTMMRFEPPRYHMKRRDMRAIILK